MRIWFSLLSLWMLILLQSTCLSVNGFRFVNQQPNRLEQLRLRRSSKKSESSKAESQTTVGTILSNADVIDPRNGKVCKAIDSRDLIRPSLPFWNINNGSNNLLKTRKKWLVVVMPQLGDFDSAEYAELLTCVISDLQEANIELRVVGIGNIQSARMFSQHTGLPLDYIRVDPKAQLHSQLRLHRGPDWDIPTWIPQSILDWFAEQVGVDIRIADTSRNVARGWLNYLAMCAGIAAPGTLREILRGYIGDKSAPERLRADEVIQAGPIVIEGVVNVQLGPIKYKSLWKDEVGYQRPAELATVRLRSMVEILTNMNQYVPDQSLIDWRGATFLLDSSSCTDNGVPLYEYRDRGVLTYSETMSRPLSFLTQWIGEERARNPLGLRDPQSHVDSP